MVHVVTRVSRPPNATKLSTQWTDRALHLRLCKSFVRLISVILSVLTILVKLLGLNNVLIVVCAPAHAVDSHLTSQASRRARSLTQVYKLCGSMMVTACAQSLLRSTGAMLATSTLLLLLAVQHAAPAVAQVVGGRCGPSDESYSNYKWIAIPTTNLRATSDSAVKGPDGDGCATSDGGAGAFVSAELPYGRFSIHSVMFKASRKGPPALKADYSLSILAGDVNTTHLASQLRGTGDADPQGALKYFTRCLRRTNFTASGKKTPELRCSFDVSVTGHWVVLFAKALTVCDVMVCGAQQLFTADGQPMTREAALKAPAGPGASDPRECTGVLACGLLPTMHGQPRSTLQTLCGPQPAACTLIICLSCNQTGLHACSVDWHHVSASTCSTPSISLVAVPSPAPFTATGYSKKTYAQCPIGSQVGLLNCEHVAHV